MYGLYLEHTAIVNITIRASPPPTIEWTIDGTIVQQGRSDGRYSAYEPQYIGNDEYNVTLAIAGLTLEDTTKTYNLRASNELGTTDYQVRISSSSKPPSSSLDVAAIVGIVVAVAVLVLIVLLVVFARATGRWCFGGKSPTNSNEAWVCLSSFLHFLFASAWVPINIIIMIIIIIFTVMPSSATLTIISGQHHPHTQPAPFSIHSISHLPTTLAMPVKYKHMAAQPSGRGNAQTKATKARC